MPLSRESQPGFEPVSLVSPALAGGFFITSTTWEAPISVYLYIYSVCVCIYTHTIESSFLNYKALDKFM